MIAIINYGLGNLSSIENMFKRLGIRASITNNHETIAKADKLLLPGVGHFKKGIDNLHETGLYDLLNELVLKEKKIILGICLGAQLMTRHSEEGNVDGFGWVDAETIKFQTEQFSGLKIPHMGWSDIQLKDRNPLWKDLPDEPRFYHVHSYHFKFANLDDVSATALYGYEFTCAFQKNNIFGTQFHPEKSHKFGMKLLENFNNL